MKAENNNQFRFLYVLYLSLFCTSFLLLPKEIKGQLGSPSSFGSSINGVVFDERKKGVTDVDIELLDEFSRLIQRTRTTGGGRFVFRGLVAGNYLVRIMPGRLGYREQTQEVIIARISRGESNSPANSQEYVDFTLQPIKAASFTENLGVETSIFIQEIPSRALEFYNKALTDFNKKDAESGMKNLKSAVDTFPKYYLALSRLGEEYIKLQDFKSARETLIKAVEVNPKSADSLYMLGYSQYILKQYAPAVSSLRGATTWSSKSAAAFLLLGMALRQTADYTEAETQMLKAKKLTKRKSPDIHWQLALLYGNNLKKYKEAANELELFLKTQPDSKDAEAIKKLIKQFRDKAVQQI